MRIFLVIFLFLTTPLFAATIENFQWQRDGRFRLSLRGEQGVWNINGVLQNDNSTSVSLNPPGRVTLHAYKEGFVTIIFSQESRPTAELFIFEWQDSELIGMRNSAITGPSATLGSDMDKILLDLKNTNQWDTALSLRALVSFMDTHPNSSMSNFVAAVESNQINEVPPPPLRAAGSFNSRSSSFNSPQGQEGEDEKDSRSDEDDNFFSRMFRDRDHDHDRGRQQGNRSARDPRYNRDNQDPRLQDPRHDPRDPRNLPNMPPPAQPQDPRNLQYNRQDPRAPQDPQYQDPRYRRYQRDPQDRRDDNGDGDRN